MLGAGLAPVGVTKNGDTALHWAAYGDLYDVAVLLLKAGANVNAVGDVGNTPLHIAATAGNIMARAPFFFALPCDDEK